MSGDPASKEIPTSSSASLPLVRGSRRSSTSSQVDVGQANQVLDEIHQSASRSNALTTFDDFSSLPSPFSERENAQTGLDSSVSNLGTIYSRLKASVAPQEERSSSRKRKDSSTDVGGGLIDSRPAQGQTLDTVQAKGNTTISFKADEPTHGRQSSDSPNVPTSSLQSPNSNNVSRSPTTSRHAKSGKPYQKRPPSSVSTRSSEHEAGFRTQSNHLIDQRISPLGFLENRSLENDSLPLIQPKVTKDGESPGASQDTKQPLNSKPTTPVVESTGTRPSLHISIDDAHKPHLYLQTIRSTTPDHDKLQPRAARYSRTLSSNGTKSPSDTSLSTATHAKTVTTSENVTALNPQPLAPNTLIYQMSQKILSRDFWLKDENAKSCFNCGDGFTTFRRKHHCRLCGQIYCNSCTSLISGRPFGQSSKLRVCKTCNAMLHEDDSSDYSEDEPSGPSQAKQLRFSDIPPRPTHSSDGKTNERYAGAYKNASFNISNSNLRRVQDGRRPSTSGFESPPLLNRPASSRSLRASGMRPKSSSNRLRRPRSQHQHMRSLSIDPDNAAILHLASSGGSIDQTLPAFVENTAVDPELEQFLSDDADSDEDAPNIASTMTAADAQGHGVLNALRKVRPRTPGKLGAHDRSSVRDVEAASVSSLRAAQLRRRMGGRTLSGGSISHLGTSRVGLSDNVLRSTDNLYAMIGRVDPLPHADQFQRRPSIPLSAMAGSDVPAEELNPASLAHLKRLLRQFNHDNQIGNPSRWDKALIPILVKCAGSVAPNIQQGDDVDMRNYIKIKKIPCGMPTDSSYVTGIVFTKTLALKDMIRTIQNPRVLVISFPLIYARHQQHFMSLEGVIAQEREYLRNLTTRIKALRPNVLLVQGDIPGLMKDFLHESGIVTVYDIKPTVLQAVARCTQTRIVSSVDKLNIDPSQLGKCGTFSIKTFSLKGCKKSFVYLSGCRRDLGCTITLHGADTKTLSKLKLVVEFLCYVAYNLRLETSLMRDQFASVLPSVQDEKDGQAAEVIHSQQEPMYSDSNLSFNTMTDILDKRALSASPFVALPHPYLFIRGREQEGQMSRLRLLQQLQDPESPVDADSHEPGAYAKFELVRPEMVYGSNADTSEQVREILRAIHRAEFLKASTAYEDLRRRWDQYASESVEPFSPLNHQKILLLFSIVSNPTSDACVGPETLGLEFYQEHDLEDRCERDIPLGEYIERLCGQAKLLCTAGRCDRRMIDHHRQYVHGDGQVSVHTERCAARFKGLENTILMWSNCKVCDFETQIAPMSGETWKYSFAKYLELSFWNKSLQSRAGTCSHDIHREHVRSFGFKNIAVRVKYDPINLVEIVVPNSVISWKVEKDLRLKNDQYQRIENRIGKYMSSVKFRLKSINLDSISQDRIEACKAKVQDLTKKANEHYDSLIKKLRGEYMASKYYEIVPMNGSVRSLQETVADWDTIFADLEIEYFPSEKDLRNLAAIQIRKILSEKEDLSQPDQDDELRDLPQGGGMNVHDEKRAETEDLAEEPSGVLETLKQSEDANLDQAQSPIQSEQVIQSLDLALPTDRLEGDSPTSSRLQIRRGQSPADLIVAHPLSSENPEPLSPEITSKIDQMESGDIPASDPPSPLQGMAAEKRQRQSINAPSLFRSQTQPILQIASMSLVKLKEEQISSKDTAEGVSAAADLSPASPMQRGTADRARAVATRMARTAVHSMIPRPINSKKFDTKVSALAKHFEQMSREFEKEKLRERRLRAARTRQSRAFPTASANPILEVFRDAQEAVHDRENFREAMKGESSGVANLSLELGTTTNNPHTNNERPEAKTELVDDNQEAQEHTLEESEEGTLMMSYPESVADGLMSDTELGTIADSQDLDEDDEQRRGAPTTESTLEMAKQEKSSFLKLLASLWSEQSASGWSQLDYPLAPTDHIFGDTDIIVREDEPSSLIAFALGSKNYTTAIQKFRDRSTAAEQAKQAKQDASADDMSVSNEDVDVESVMLGKTATHMKYQFEAGQARMQCRIFYAESFDAIRRKCGVADRFGESLSRCLKWDSKGGKTKSLFLKTLDDRFVLKSLSQIETQAFLKFAPDYFDFMSKCLFHSLPSALAKMLGLYQVVIKNPVTGVEFNWFLQVMENVFYEGPSKRMFDLKGSMRNRKVEITGDKDEVLLDENLLDYISQTPLYLRYHSNSVLRSSIANDTLFCAKQNVMDYSLIVGFYEDRKELVVGIIDYIRTYTWDKKLETWIKDRGKHKATVRSPKEYRARFRRSIPRYFPHAPSCWQSFWPTRLEHARELLVEEEDEEEGELEEEIAEEERR